MHRSLMSMQGMPVTSEQGLRLGAVTDAYFDPLEQRIIAFMIDWENDLVRGPEDLLPITQIAQLNADILTVSHEMAASAGLEYDFQVETEGLVLAIEQLVGKPVTLGEGETLGELADILFDPQDGSVAFYEVDDADMAEERRPNLLLPTDPDIDFLDDKLEVPEEMRERIKRREKQVANPILGVTFSDGANEEELVGEDDVEVYRSPNIKPY